MSKKCIASISVQFGIAFFPTNKKIRNSECFFSNNVGCNIFSGFPSKLSKLMLIKELRFE